MLLKKKLKSLSKTITKIKWFIKNIEIVRLFRKMHLRKQVLFSALSACGSCDRCDRPLSDPTANITSYGWRRAQIMGINSYNDVTFGLDEEGVLLYNFYADYLSKNDANDFIINLATAVYNYDSSGALKSVGL